MNLDKRYIQVFFIVLFLQFLYIWNDFQIKTYITHCFLLFHSLLCFAISWYYFKDMLHLMFFKHYLWWFIFNDAYLNDITE